MILRPTAAVEVDRWLPGYLAERATLLVVIVALVACVTYLRAHFLASLRVLRTCFASDVYTLHSTALHGIALHAYGCVRGLETGPRRSHALTPGLSGRSQLCRSPCALL